VYLLRNVSSVRRLLPVVIALFTLLALSGQAFVQSVSTVSAASKVSHPTITCQAAPHVKSPPLLKGVLPATTQSSQAVCGTGMVPQPQTVKTSAASLKGIAPAGVTQRGLQPSIAAGYHYVYGYQYATAIGAEGYLSQHHPNLSTSDSHTLAEIAGESSDGRQIVEIGWTVDRGVNGDTNPHLFIYHWVNGGSTCYNGCGYVQYSSTLYPGMTVASDGTQPLYAMEYYQGNWWLWYNTAWIGYFPGTLWSSAGVTFTQLGLTQWFGEVASGGGLYTQMGNGIFGSNAGSASIVNAALITSTTSASFASVSLNATNPSCFNYGWITPNYSFRYGGPGC
jgi:hypothetical protein